MRKLAAILAMALVVSIAQADFAPNPKGAVKALKVESGKPFRSGMVFIDGKYIPPPYTVQRYGLVLRINKIPVTGPLIPWERFVKTQEGVKATKTVTGGGETPAEETVDLPEIPEEDDDDMYGDDDFLLSDLFDDEPAVKKSSSASKNRPARKPKPRKPTVTVTYSFDGEFKHNDKTKALLKKISQARTDIDAHLRKGGFVCFGSRYTCVKGDSGTARIVLDKLPGLMQNSPDAKSLATGVRASGISFFPEALCEDLFSNRVDYRKLLERQKALKDDEQINNLINRGY